MYPFFGILLLFLFVLVIVHFYRRKCIIKHIRCMTAKEKCEKINALVQPFGYCYDHCQDIFSSTLDAWQRSFGYCSLYDKMAPHFQMIFDCLPIYFDYNGKTWLIELWKGQYGINTGAEIGVYHADEIIAPDKRKYELFHAADNEELFPLAFALQKQHHTLARFRKEHWWLTGFDVGCYSQPKDLAMNCSINFPDSDMQQAFLSGLAQAEVQVENIRLYQNSVSFSFCSCPSCLYRLPSRIYRKFVQWKNHLFCKYFRFMTKPFTCSADQVLYLYEYAPFAFRRLFSRHHLGKLSRKQKKTIFTNRREQTKTNGY